MVSDSWVDCAVYMTSLLGRPRTRPTRERSEWHYHLGGVRHCRVPLSADLKEVLEVQSMHLF